MASKGIAKHLIDFCVSHLEIHGKTRQSHAYIKSNIELWREKYGEPISIEVTKAVRKAWDEKKAEKTNPIL
jgi:hypothetical protein